MTLRASALAAVITFVWSTRLKPMETAHSRTTCRTATTSSCPEIGRGSRLRTATRPLGLPHRVAGVGPAIRPLRLPQRAADQRHALLDVERRADARQRQAELDQRDRHGG